MDYARNIQPFRSKMHFEELADALNGAEEAQNCSVTVDSTPNDSLNSNGAPSFPIPVAKSTFYVDASKGSDSNQGTLSSPFQTIAKAVTAARSSGKGSTIALREGTFYLTDTIQLGPADSGLSIRTTRTKRCGSVEG